MEPELSPGPIDDANDAEASVVEGFRGKAILLSQEGAGNMPKRLGPRVALLDEAEQIGQKSSSHKRHVGHLGRPPSIEAGSRVPVPPKGRKQGLGLEFWHLALGALDQVLRVLVQKVGSDCGDVAIAARDHLPRLLGRLVHLLRVGLQDALRVLEDGQGVGVGLPEKLESTGQSSALGGEALSESRPFGGPDLVR
eukprot:9298457-Alexandrium_andersonii.AAC.1